MKREYPREVRSETVRANNLAHLPPQWIDRCLVESEYFPSQTAAPVRQLFEIPFAEFSANFVFDAPRWWTRNFPKPENARAPVTGRIKSDQVSNASNSKATGYPPTSKGMQKDTDKF